MMLISCVAYRNGERLADIEPHEIHNYIVKPDCFVWVALLEPDNRALELMQAEFDLHPLAVEDARHGHQRPKIEEYGDSLFAVLQMIESVDGELRTGEVDVFVGRNYILSVRSGVEKGFSEVRARAEHEPELLKRGPGYVFYALMDAVVDRYFPVLHEVETELERIEEQIFANVSPRTNIEALYALKQKLMICRHAVGPLLESLGNITGARVPGLCSGMQEYFRDISDHLQRLNQTIESVRDTISTAISVNLSMITLQESETMKRLAAYAALIAVPTLIVGIYGMNFDYMPELRWRYGYASVLTSMAAIDAYLFYRFRKAKWL
ncbi:MAG TPA: magnesium/cobalt transporter CorA [Steroidobacter sp.]